MKIALLQFASGVTLIGFVEDVEAEYCSPPEPDPADESGEVPAAVISLYQPARVEFGMGQVDAGIIGGGRTQIAPYALPIPMQVSKLRVDTAEIVAGYYYDCEPPAEGFEDPRERLVISYLMVVGSSAAKAASANEPPKPGRQKIQRQN